MAGALNGLSHTTLEFERGAGDAAGEDFSPFVEELFLEFGVLLVDVFYFASFLKAKFFGVRI